MSWSETRRRWRAMREIEELLSGDPAAELPWTEEYAELFGDRAGLVAALRYRWDLARSTQLDSRLPERVLDEQRRRLAHRSRGVRRVLDGEAAGEEGGQRVVA